jgi:hypothetical protein
MALACQEKTSPIDRKMYKKPIFVLTHEVLTGDPLVPAFGFNRKCQRLTRPDGRDLQSALNKEIKSAANVSRRNLSEFLELASEMRIKPEIQEFALEEANQALVELKTRRIPGAKVLRIG